MQEMKIKFEDEENKKKYKQRAIIEGNFGHMFNNLGFNGFKTRTDEQVQCEADILSFATNIKHLYNVKEEIDGKIQCTNSKKYMKKNHFSKKKWKIFKRIEYV